MTNLFKKEIEEVKKKIEDLKDPVQEFKVFCSDDEALRVIVEYSELKSKLSTLETCEKIVNKKVEMLKKELADPHLDCWYPNQIINKIFGDEK